MESKLTDLTSKILQGRGSKKAEMVLRGGKIFDLITGNFLEGDVAICGDTIVGTCDTYEAKNIIGSTTVTIKISRKVMPIC